MSDNNELLSERKQLILKSAVEDYIESALPITSSGVKKRHIKDISTATLRNELNALEAMGYLKQLHTSSGRVPTTKAYRFYVNGLMKNVKCKVDDLSSIKNMFNTRAQNLTTIVSGIAKTISQVTNYPTVVVVDNLKNLVIDDIKVIPLIDYNALILIQTNGGIINNSFAINPEITNDDCINCAKLLTNTFKTKTISYLIDNIDNVLQSTNKDLDSYKTIFNAVIDMLQNAMQNGVQKGGANKLLNCPEYSDVEKASKILNLLDDEKTIKDVVDCEDSDDVNFSIGGENKNDALKDCTVVKAPIKIDGKTVASVGVIGPQRLDYSYVAGALKYVVSEIEKMNELQYDGKGDKNGKK